MDIFLHSLLIELVHDSPGYVWNNIEELMILPFELLQLMSNFNIVVCYCYDHDL